MREAVECTRVEVMENQSLRDGIGLGLLILAIAAVEMWGAVLGA
jgi:hypothetical protein